MFLGIKQPEREVGHLPSSGAEVKSEEIYTSTPSACIYLYFNLDNLL